MIKSLEFRRQLYHMIVGALVVVLLYYEIINVGFLLVLLVLSFFVALLSKRFKIPFIWWMLERFEREENLKFFPGKGAISMLLGMVLALLLFERDIALASMMILVLGDSVGALVGPLGKIKHRKPFSQKKLLEGTFAGIIAAFIGAVIFVSKLEAFLASFIAISVEALEITIFNEKLDDNLVIPLIAGAVMTLMRLYF